jgi:outer membrane protein assembly factor BamB
MAADYDDGNGTYSSPFGSLLNGTIDYVTGLITNFQTAPFYYNNTYANLANYTTYECDVTPATGVTTNPSGAFSASITVPDVYNGEYEITAIDTQGNTATAALTVVGGEDPPQLEWPMFHNDLQNTGYSESPAPDTNQTLWNFNMSAATVCSPAVVDGRVYIGDWTNKMYCLDAATGTSIWNYTANGAMTSSPAVVDGKVYVGSLDGKIYCLDAATGAEIWKYFTNAALFYGGPAVAYGVVYVGAGARVYAFGTEVIPEGITLAVMLLLSTVAVIVSIRYFRKRPKWQKW